MTSRPLPPGRLRSTLRHAERFAVFLEHLEIRRPEAIARAWLMGRRQEIACFVQQVVRDLRSRRRDETAAEVAIERYLATLHLGVRTHFGERSPACCRAPLDPKRVAVRRHDGTPTTLYVPKRDRTPEPRATWLDVQPEDLIAGLLSGP